MRKFALNAVLRYVKLIVCGKPYSSEGIKCQSNWLGSIEGVVLNYRLSCMIKVTCLIRLQVVPYFAQSRLSVWACKYQDNVFSVSAGQEMVRKKKTFLRDKENSENLQTNAFGDHCIIKSSLCLLTSVRWFSCVLAYWTDPAKIRTCRLIVCVLEWYLKSYF